MTCKSVLLAILIFLISLASGFLLMRAKHADLLDTHVYHVISNESGTFVLHSNKCWCGVKG